MLKTDTLKLGTSRRVITPPKGIYLAGYGDRKGGRISVRDELTATASVWAAGEFQAAVVSLDMLGINHQVTERIRSSLSRRIKLNTLEICCSHTHSGPIGWAPERISPFTVFGELIFRLMALPAGLRQPAGWLKNKKYIDSLVCSVTEAVLEAAENLEEVRLYSGRAPLKTGINRRQKDDSGNMIIGQNSEGPAPQEVTVLQAVSVKTFSPVLTLVNYACHGVLLGPASYAVSADWTGEMRRLVEKQVPGYCAYLQGGCGNINPVNMQWGEEAEHRLEAAGKEAADAVLAALRRKESLPGDLTGDLTGQATDFTDNTAGDRRSAPRAPEYIAGEKIINIKTVLKNAENIENTESSGSAGNKQSRKLKKLYRTALAKEAGLPGWIVDPVLHFRYPWHTQTAVSEDGTVTTPVRISFLKTGAFSLCTVSMEPFFETAEKIRETAACEMQKMTGGSCSLSLFAGYTNGLTGYLPTSDAVSEGGYEVTTGPYFYRLPGLLEDDAEKIIIDGFKALISSRPAGPRKIRRAAQADKAAIAEVCRKTFYDGPDFPYPELISLRWSDWYADNSAENCFVAVDPKDRAVGYILCAPDSKFYMNDFSETVVPKIRKIMDRVKTENTDIYRKYKHAFLPPVDEYNLPGMKKIITKYPAHLHIDLLPEYQKAGIGGALMNSLTDHLKEKQIRGVHLIVGKNNNNAVGFYRSRGFEILKALGHGVDASLVMGLTL